MSGGRTFSRCNGTLLLQASYCLSQETELWPFWGKLYFCGRASLKGLDQPPQEWITCREANLSLLNWLLSSCPLRTSLMSQSTFPIAVAWSQISLQAEVRAEHIFSPYRLWPHLGGSHDQMWVVTKILATIQGFWIRSHRKLTQNQTCDVFKVFLVVFNCAVSRDFAATLALKT